MSAVGRQLQRSLQQSIPEPDAALILERAAELQRHASDTRRMSIAELEEAAASAGISPVHVRRAAYELSLRRARRDRSSKLLGGPRTILIEVALEGEIPVVAYEYVIEALRRHTGELGVASLIGRSLTWSAHPSHSRGSQLWARSIALTIVPRGGRTCIRIEEKLDLLVRGVFGSILGGVGAGGGAAPSLGLGLLGFPALAVVGLGAWSLGCWALARRAYRGRVALRERQLHGALEAIIDIAGESIRAAAA